MPETPPPPRSKLPVILSVVTVAAAFVGAAVVYVLRGGLTWLPVLLIGSGTALVASALTPNLPGPGEAWNWWRGRSGSGRPNLGGGVGAVPGCLYVGVWLILLGTALGAVVR